MADIRTPNDPLTGQEQEDLIGIVQFRRKGVQPASTVYVAQDDTIELRGISPTTSTTINVSLRYMNPKGEIIPEFYTIVVNGTAAAPTLKQIPGSEGFLLSASIEGNPVQRGQCFVSLVLIRGLGSGDNTFGGVILQGYVAPVGSIGFPQTPVQQGVDGRGAMRAVVGTVPAAGGEVLDVVPAGRQWILRAARVSLTTAVAVANREATLTVDDGAGHIMAQSADPTVIAASLTFALSWAAGFVTALGVASHSIPWMYECRLLPGWRITTVTAAIQAADQYTAPVYMIEEFINA